MGFDVRYKKRNTVANVNGNTIVWRYMGHEKFIRLIRDSSLWFSRASAMSDKYELTIPEHSIEAFRKHLIESGVSKKKIESKEYDYYWENEPNKESSLINCWSRDRDENYALWKIYLGGDKDGVGIRTTAGKLRNSLIQKQNSINYSTDFKFSMGEVKYSHYIKYDELNPVSVLTTKKPFYKFENEIRLFALEQDYAHSLLSGNTKGINVPVDLDVLLQEVYISPFSTLSYRKEVESLLRSYSNMKERIKLSQVWDS